MTVPSVHRRWMFLALAVALISLMIGYALLHRPSIRSSSTVSPSAIASRVGTAYGDPNPQISLVRTDQTDNPPHQKMYLITLRGSFHKGDVQAQGLDFSATADGRDTWAIRGLTGTGSVAWLDSSLP